MRYKLFFLFCICFTISAKAQFIPNTTFINTPYGNIPITSYYHMPIAYWNLGNKSTTIYTKDYYTVKLKNDSTIRVYGEINLSDSIHYLFIKEKKKMVRKIYPNETQYIVALGDNNLRVAGKPNDSCWVFQQLNDSISLFSVVPVDSDMYSIYFTKQGSSDLISLTESNLLALVGDDENLIKIIKKDKNYVKAIKKYNTKLRKDKN